jgi:hypothetical protein
VIDHTYPPTRAARELASSASSRKDFWARAVAIRSLFFVDRFFAAAWLFSPLEKWLSAFARNKTRAVAVCFLAAIAFRVVLLPWHPVPSPTVHDEFSYLLAADTFAHGRLANPPHPMWLYFDTFHVNQHPAVMSKYPPAQGAALPLGQLLGHPWIGVVLSTAAMFAASLWAFQGWLPPQWAFLGASLLLLRLGVSGYWIDSYWGGAMAALGGALTLGAAGRLVRFWRPRDSLILGVGMAILALSRPFEGLIYSTPILAYVVYRLVASKTRPYLPIFHCVILPFATVVVVLLAFLAYYNWRLTGNALLFPYTLNDRIYERASPALIWEKPNPNLLYANPQMASFYNGWARDTWRLGRTDSVRHAARILRNDAQIFAGFFLWPELCLPLFASFWVLRNSRLRLLVFQLFVCFAGYLLVAWFQPHYAAPVAATTFLVLTQAIRHMRRWRLWDVPIGIAMTRWVVFAAVLLAPFHAKPRSNPEMIHRARVAAALAQLPGDHLVIVRYSQHHDDFDEWVYNAADVDHAKIVWAREIPGMDNAPFVNYFRGRNVWVVDADSPAPYPHPYEEEKLRNAVIPSLPPPGSEPAAHP